MRASSSDTAALAGGGAGAAAPARVVLAIMGSTTASKPTAGCVSWRLAGELPNVLQAQTCDWQRLCMPS